MPKKSTKESQRASVSVPVLKFKVAGRSVVVGPGAVPSSASGAERTDIIKVVSGLKRASRQGLFEKDLGYGFSR